MLRMLVLVVCIVACGGRTRSPTPVAIEAKPPPERESPPPPEPPGPPADAATCAEYDPKHPGCKSDCDHGDCKCPSPPDRENPACWAVMPCTDPPDRRIRACHVGHDCFGSPSCEGPTQPIITRVIKADTDGNDVIIVLGVGTANDVTKEWHAVELERDTESPLADVVLVSFSKRQIVGRVHLPLQQVVSNPRVRLTPPSGK